MEILVLDQVLTSSSKNCTENEGGDCRGVFLPIAGILGEMRMVKLKVTGKAIA